MSNSPLVIYTNLSPNVSHPRNHAIDTITIHVMDGNLTVERCLSLPRFQTPDPKGGASCNYAVDSKGRIGLGANEEDRSWCSSDRANDHRAITIEVANDGGKETGYHVSDAALAALTDLLEDICRRNGKKKLLWFGDKAKTLAYEPAPDEMRMTVHRWFAAKACPGDYLYGKHGEIAAEVTRRLNKEEEDKPVIYKHLSDIPSEESRRIVSLLMQAGILAGYGADETGDTVLDLSGDMVRIIALNYRGGAYDRKLISEGLPPAVEERSEEK